MIDNKKRETEMLINIFKKNYPLQLLLLVIVPLVLWIPAFVNPPEVFQTKFDMPLYELVYETTFQFQRMATICSFVLVFLQALAFNYLMTSNHLCQKTTFFPAFVYILLMSCNVQTMTFSSILFSNLFLIIALHFFFKCSDKKEGIDEIFQSSFCLAVASLFYAPAIFFIFWMWGGLIVYKLYKWRSWSMSILGLLTPFLLLCVVYYLQDISITQELFKNAESWVKIDFNFLNIPVQVVYTALLVLYLIPALFHTISSRANRIIEYRKKSGVLVTMFIVSLLPFFLSKTQENMSFLFAIPFSFFLCNLFMNHNKEKHADRFLLIFVLCCIAKVYINL
jgi:hypothetical protein